MRAGRLDGYIPRIRVRPRTCYALRNRRPQSPARPAVGVAGAPVMAKGQARSNKEIRKPKAEKAKPAVAVGSSPFTQVPGKK